MNWQVVAAVALIVVWAVYWKAFVKNFWKILYTVLAVAAFLFLMKFAWFCVEKAFTPRTAELQIVASGNVDLAKVVGLDSYKATYELFNSHFSQLLVILGFLGTMFGVLIPAGAYLLQRQSLKDERERMEKDFKAREDSIIERATAAAKDAKEKAEESLRLAEVAKGELNLLDKRMKSNFSVILRTIGYLTYDDVSACEKNDKEKHMKRTITCLIWAVIFDAKAGHKGNCIYDISVINSFNIILLKKFLTPINAENIKIVSNCLGDDFHKFKEVYNKYFETPLE